MKIIIFQIKKYGFSYKKFCQKIIIWLLIFIEISLNKKVQRSIKMMIKLRNYCFIPVNKNFRIHNAYKF